jgi:hypothetical protein
MKFVVRPAPRACEYHLDQPAGVPAGPDVELRAVGFDQRLGQGCLQEMGGRSRPFTLNRNSGEPQKVGID